MFTESVHGMLDGEIIQVEGVYGSIYDDGTYGGDSGLIWKSSGGLAVGMHVKGLGEGSKLSFCMSTRRIANQLQGRFVEI